MPISIKLVTFLLGVLSIPETNAGQKVFKKPEITSLHINSDIKYRFATTTVTSRVKNVDLSTSREAEFDVTLPNEAFITNLTLETNGKIIQGEIKEKEVAKKQYEAARQRGESAGYVGTKHRETNRFTLKVTVAPQDKISFNLTYQELLKRTRGHYEQVIYIDPGQPVPEMDVTVSIVESREITELRVPPLRNDVMADIDDVSDLTVISRPTSKTAHVKFVPSIEFQTAQSTSGIMGQFIVQYDVEREMDLGDVLVVNGYFVHFFAPDGFQPIPNDVLFILDTSGSMTGKKINQLKNAMQSILRQMNEGDRINIMSFSGSTSFWKTKMVDIMDEDTMEEAKSHISALKCGGWTNIDLALTAGVTFLRDRSHSDGAIRSPVIVFLTDGEATNGVTDPQQILKNIRSVNEGDIPIFSLAFGEYADYDLVKKISIQNNGLARKIYEASDAAMQIAGFYNEISVTLLNNITFQYLDAPVTNMTKHQFSNYFNGSEMVICGRLADSSKFSNDLEMQIIGDTVDGANVILSSGNLSGNLIDLNLDDNATDSDDYEEITEKVWAYLTIKEMLNKELATSNKEEKGAYRRQVLELSLKYDFVTPLTSMVVTLPDEKETQEEIAIGGELDNLAPPPVSHPRQRGPSGIQHMTRFHSKRIAMSGAYLSPESQDMAYPAYDTAPSISKMGGGRIGKPKTMHDKARKQRKKNKKRRKNKQTYFKYPLRVYFPSKRKPILVCFSLYHADLENSTDNYYVFYADANLDLKVEIKLVKTMVGGWTKQGSIEEIHLSSSNLTHIVTKGAFETRSVTANDKVPWEVEYTPVESDVPATEIRLKFDAFDITLKKTDDGFITAEASRSARHSSLTGDGIISQIMSKTNKKAKLKGINKAKRKAPTMAVLKMGKSKVPVIKRPLEAKQSCWAMKGTESPMLDMSVAKLPMATDT